jgi:hypothetical protein
MSEACRRQESSLRAILFSRIRARFDLVNMMPIVAGNRLGNFLRGERTVIAGMQHIASDVRVCFHH